MKEKDPVELTTKEYNFTLEVRRDIFMPEPGGGEFQSQPSEPTKKEGAQEKIEASKSAWDKLNEGRTVSIDERRTQQMLIERGIMPMTGGSGEDEPSSSSTEPTPEREATKASSLKDASEILASLKREAEVKIAGLSAEEAHEYERVRRISEAMGIPQSVVDTQIVDALIRMRGREKAESAEGYHLPESLEDLALLIMKSEGEDWKEGGKKELIRDGHVVKEHFLAWVRKRAREIDRFNPVTNINLFSDINVKFGYSTISFYEMIFTGSYFLERKKEEDGSFTYHKNEDYEKLKQELITEAFLYNSDKNSWVTYKGKMHSEEELPGVMMGLWYANPNLRSNYLEHIMTLSSTSEHEIDKVKRETGEAFEGNEIGKLLEGNNTLGEGIRRAFLTYFHISDYEMLEKIHGRDSVLFKEKYKKIDSDTGKVKIEDGKPADDIEGRANEEHKKRQKQGDKKVKVIKYKDGKLDTSDSKNKKTFINYVNIFNNANKDSTIVDEVRERIRQYLMDSLNLDYEEASFAEGWAYNKTLPMGLGARNDLNAAGFDAYSKQMNILPYRLKQFEAKRKGQIGNPFDIGIVKRTSLTPLEEITDVHGRTIIEALQGGQGSEYHSHNPFDKKSEGYKSMSFGQDEGQRWSSMAFLNGDSIRKMLMEGTGFDIESMLTYDQYGRPIIDQKKADEFLERVQKAMRYKWCTWDRTDYSKTVRVWDQKKVPDTYINENGEEIQKTDRNGKPAEKIEVVFRDVPVVAAYFGSEVIGFIKSDIERVKERTGKSDEDLREGRPKEVWEIDDIGGDNKIDVSEIQESDIRDYLWKHVEKALVGKKLEAHRNVYSELRRYNYAIIEKFYDFFKTKGIFDDEDEKEVRKLSKTSQRRLLAEEVPSSLLLGFLAGAWKEIRKVAPEIVK